MSNGTTQPVLFLSHGGGPSFFLSAKEMPMLKGMDKDSKARRYLEGMAKQEKLPQPRAILVVSAHWEERTFTVQTAAQPSLYYDYYGFPDDCYQLKWPARGDPDVAARVCEVLKARGLECATDAKRGYDHGVFIPLLLIYPQPPAPVLQLSLKSNLKADEHFALGEALAVLRKEGILIIASGFTTHSRIEFRDGKPAQWVMEFQAALHRAISDRSLSPADRKKQLAAVLEHPSFPKAHPRSEHFLPLLVAAAAAGYGPARILFQDAMGVGGLLEHYMFED